MKALKFNELPATKAWDRYSAFYKAVGQYEFILFETGEFRINHVEPDPDVRRHYESLGIELYATNDTLPYGIKGFRAPDGEDVAPAWMDVNGQQYLLIDHTHNIAVRLSPWRDREKVFGPLPEHLAGCSAYYPNVRAKPIGAPILLSKPDPRGRKKETQKWLADLQAVATVLYQMQDKEYREWQFGSKLRIDGAKVDITVPPNEYAATLKPDYLANIHYRGAMLDRVRSEVPYLEVVK